MQSHLQNCPSDDFLYKCLETVNVCTSVLKELRVLTAMKLFLMSSSVMSSTAGLKIVPESYTENINISITGDNQGEKTPATPVPVERKKDKSTAMWYSYVQQQDKQLA